eukprot:4860191-Amphidinium_carterae.1
MDHIRLTLSLSGTTLQITHAHAVPHVLFWHVSVSLGKARAALDHTCACTHAHAPHTQTHAHSHSGHSALWGHICCLSGTHVPIRCLSGTHVPQSSITPCFTDISFTHPLPRSGSRPRHPNQCTTMPASEP